MSKARDAILQRLYAERPDIEPNAERDHYSCFDWSLSERLQRFQERMEAVRAEVHHCDKQDWLSSLKQICHDKQLNNLLISPETHYGEQVYAQAADFPSLCAYDQSIEAWQDTLFWHTDASLTTTLGGIAETGSLMLWPSTHEPRLMSLVPSVHIALLETQQLYSTFAEAMHRQQWQQDQLPSNALLISGPSKSADIEQTLAYGVHGPKALIVILINTH